MLFNSWVFLGAFLPLTLLGWWWLSRREHRLLFLALASVFFYAWWDWRYVPLLLLVTAVDHYGARLMVRSEGRRRRRIFLATVGINVLALAAFKASGLMSSTLNGLGDLVGAGSPLPALELALPLGVGFFTLNGISYLVDVHRGLVPAAPSASHFTAYLAMFPHLIAGPIVRYAEILPQLSALPRRPNSELMSRGLTLLTLGLAKKLLVADALAPHVEIYFDATERLTFTSAWAATLGYAMQLYFDFSAYSDMAAALALMLGIRFPRNFNAPFRSRNVSEFWRRWHVTLGTWIRDYLFIPLGGSRRSTARTSLNLVFVMALGGLWHGPTFNFVVFGIYYGVLLAVHRILRDRGLLPASALAGQLATTLAFAFGMALFRAPDLPAAGEVITAMLGMQGLVGGPDVTVGFAAAVAALLAFTHFGPDLWDLAFRPRLTRRFAVVCGLLGAASVLELSDPSPFLYFRF